MTGQKTTENINNVAISLNALKSLTATKEFNDSQSLVNDLSISADGKEMIISTEEDVILLYDMYSGCKIRNVDSKKYGVGLLTHVGNNNCIHSSTKVDHSVRHLSLTESKYHRYFTGHTDIVNGLHVSAAGDTFMSSSNDKTVRFWDLRAQHCQGFMTLHYKPITCYDPEGIVFAVGTNNDTIKLYDVRSFDHGPFTTFKIPKDGMDEWTSLKISPCGKMMLICTNGKVIKVIDAFNGNVRHVLHDHENSKHVPLRATITPDSKYVYVGSSDRCIYGYSLSSGVMCHKLETAHSETPHIVHFSPKQFCLASVCKKLILWGPNDDYLTEQFKLASAATVNSSSSII